MKKYLIYFTLLMVLFTGCAKDDESRDQEAETVPLMTRAQSGFVNVDLLYNDNRTVQKIAIADNDIIINFQYNQEKISSLQFQFDGPNSEASTYTYTYDGSDRIKTINDGVETLAITYDEVEKEYTYSKDNNIFTVKLTDTGEVAVMSKLEENGNFYDYEYFYAPENFGPLTNTNAVTLYVLLAIPDPLIAFIATYFTQKPIDRYEDDNDIFNFENTFNEEGILISRDYLDFNDQPDTVIFKYTEL